MKGYSAPGHTFCVYLTQQIREGLYFLQKIGHIPRHAQNVGAMVLFLPSAELFPTNGELFRFGRQCAKNGLKIANFRRNRGVALADTPYIGRKGRICLDLCRRLAVRTRKHSERGATAVSSPLLAMVDNRQILQEGASSPGREGQVKKERVFMWQALHNTKSLNLSERIIRGYTSGNPFQKIQKKKFAE